MVSTGPKSFILRDEELADVGGDSAGPSSLSSDLLIRARGLLRRLVASIFATSDDASCFAVAVESSVSSQHLQRS